MIRKVFISPLVPTHFVKMDAVRLDKYNNPILNESWLTEQRYSWSEEIRYAQKVQKSDSFTFEAWTNSAQTAGATIKVYNCDRTLVDTLTPDIEELPNVFDGYDTQISYSSPAYWETLDEGTYYFVLEIPFPDESVVGYISEPQGLSEKWEDTIYIEYRNSKNKKGVIFYRTNTKFGLRIEGSLKDNEQLVDRVVLNDQDNDTEPIYANAYDGYTLVLGSQYSWVPDYAVRTANNIFSCDATLIDGTQYTAADGAAFEKQREDNYNLCVATLDIRTPDSEAISETAEGGLTVRENANDYPYVFWSYSIRKGSFAAYSYGVATYIHDNASRDAFMAEQNTVHYPNNGLTGTLEMEGDTMIYSLGIGEIYDNVVHLALTKYYDINQNAPTATNLNLQIAMQGQLSGLSKYALVAPNNTVSFFNEINNTLTGIEDNYFTTSSGAQVHRMFHDDTMYLLSHDGDYIEGFTGDVPMYLFWFGLQNSPSVTSFDIYDTLEAAKNSLGVLIITGCANLDVISNYYVDFNDRMFNLKTLTLQNNSLNVSGLDALYINIAGVLPFSIPPPNGSIKTNGQTPTAVPTAASAAARSYLINNRFWTITL